MITVIQALDKFLAEIVNLDPDNTKKARASRDWLVKQIHAFPEGDDEFPNIYEEKNIFFGSFSRKTKKKAFG